MRVCVVYDCLFPHTIGGAERWYRSLSEQLAAAGHDVTYLTLRQWPPGADPAFPGVGVVAVGSGGDFYAHGRRRLGPPLRFGAGVLLHLLRHGRRYDVVHTASFPYFSGLAAAAVRPLGRYRLVVDWVEVWTRDYWREYLGGVRGTLGHAVQRLLVRVPQRALCFSQLHARRLEEEGFRGDVTVLPGLYDGPLAPSDPAPAEAVVVFAGRFIPEKRVPALIRAVARARHTLPELRCELYGDGPEREAVQQTIAAEGLNGAVSAPGFVPPEQLDAAIRRALCLVLPSVREGYGQVVMQAASLGTPVVVAAAPDSAAPELVEEGRNGFVARSADADDLADAIRRVDRAGPALRRATAEWFAENGERRSVARSLEAVLAAYRQ